MPAGNRASRGRACPGRCALAAGERPWGWPGSASAGRVGGGEPGDGEVADGVRPEGGGVQVGAVAGHGQADGAAERTSGGDGGAARMVADAAGVDQVPGDVDG